MKILLFFSFFLVFQNYSFAQNEFLENQLSNSRVRAAKELHQESIKKQLADKGIYTTPKEIYLRVFKFDYEIEVWVKPTEHDSFIYLKSYKICKISGELGPKRQQGDLQVPEGFYNLSTFNPVSSFHLSVKMNYPNESDRILGQRGNLGGDIFIHGKCVTIGCIPIEDENMEELYWFLALVKAQGGKLPIHIFPFKLNQENITFFKSQSLFYNQLWTFWYQLKDMYDFFEKYKRPANYTILDNGSYFINEP